MEEARRAAEEAWAFSSVAVPPKEAFETQSVKTGRACNRVAEEVARLKTEPTHKECGSSASAKLEFLEINMKIYDSIMKEVDTKTAALEARRRQAARRDDPTQMQVFMTGYNRKLAIATQMLHHMEEKMDDALNMSNGCWVAYWQETKSWVRKHWPTIKKVLAWLGFAGAVLAGVRYRCVGICLLSSFLESWFGWGLVAPACACAGASWVSTVAAGLVGGLCFVALGMFCAGVCGCLAELLRYLGLMDSHVSEQLNQQKALEREIAEMIERFKKDNTTAQQLEEFRQWDEFKNTTEKTFCRIGPTDGQECIICYEPISATAVGREMGVRAPSCQGMHFVHSKCFSDWQRAPAGTLACVSCGL